MRRHSTWDRIVGAIPAVIIALVFILIYVQFFSWKSACEDQGGTYVQSFPAWECVDQD